MPGTFDTPLHRYLKFVDALHGALGAIVSMVKVDPSTAMPVVHIKPGRALAGGDANSLAIEDANSLLIELDMQSTASDQHFTIEDVLVFNAFSLALHGAYIKVNDVQDIAANFTFAVLGAFCYCMAFCQERITYEKYVVRFVNTVGTACPSLFASMFASDEDAFIHALALSHSNALVNAMSHMLSASSNALSPAMLSKFSVFTHSFFCRSMHMN